MIGTTRIERYVLYRTLTALGGALAVIASVVALVDFVDISRTVGVRANVSFVQVVGLTALTAPSTILVLTPFVFLFGTLAAFVGLNRRSELIAMRAAGVSAWRFIFPAAGAALLIGVLTVTTLNPLAASMNAAYENSRNSLLENYLKTAPRPLWLRQSDGRNQIVIRALGRDHVDGSVRLKGVSLFILSPDLGGGMTFSRRVEASEARLMSGFWQLSEVREASPGAGAIQSESLSIPSPLDERSASERFISPEAVAFWRLSQAITDSEKAGFSATSYRLRLQQLFATPLLFASMSVLAAAFSLRLIRLGGLATLTGSGVALGFIFYFFNQLCQALGKAEVIAPFAAAWTPPMMALLCGFTLLCYTEDG
jgi:lipopolysaccharide export system permease protein